MNIQEIKDKKKKIQRNGGRGVKLRKGATARWSCLEHQAKHQASSVMLCLVSTACLLSILKYFIVRISI